MVYNYQIGKNKVKLLTEYEIVTQNVLLHIESLLQNTKLLQHAQFHFVACGLKILDQGNSDNNLESHCT
jgi:hypothetical protein